MIHPHRIKSHAIKLLNRAIEGLTDDGDNATRRVGVAGSARFARTDRLVVDDAALGVESARAGAGVDAFLVHARLVRRAVAVDDALRTAVGRRADHSGQTVALGPVVHRFARAVRTARRWHARVAHNRSDWRSRCRCLKTTVKFQSIGRRVE